MKGEDIAETLGISQSEVDRGVCKLVITTTGLTVAVRVPRGTSNGEVVTVRGFGIEGFGGGPPGDLNVIVVVSAEAAIEKRI